MKASSDCFQKNSLIAAIVHGCSNIWTKALSRSSSLLNYMCITLVTTILLFIFKRSGELAPIPYEMSSISEWRPAYTEGFERLCCIPAENLGSSVADVSQLSEPTQTYGEAIPVPEAFASIRPTMPTIRNLRHSDPQRLHSRSGVTPKTWYPIL